MNRSNFFKGALCLATVTTAALASNAGAETPRIGERTKEVLSPVYRVDKKYKSMMGPQSTAEVHLGDPKKNELVWITGYDATMVGADGRSSMPQEFMCHSNLDLDPTKHAKAVDAQRGISGRLFTLSQGQFSIVFPKGFGIPMRSSEPLSLTTQVLNLNLDDPENLEVRHRVTVRYAKEDEAKGRMKPLFQKSAYGLALLEGPDGHFGVDPGEGHGEGCLMRDNASEHEYDDPQGRRFTGHWVVKPGREENRTNVTRLIGVPYDTTAHYIAVHLHPFAETLELVDKTAKKTVFKSRARNFSDKIGLEHVDFYSSEAGIPFYEDHEYELVSVYDNKTKEPQDSMAVMYIYMLDKEFERP